jgi:hypothetical protein
MKLPSIRQVYLEAGRAARRFPFVLFCMLAVSITALMLIESEPKQSIGFPIIFAAALGLPLLTSLALCAEKRKWSLGLSMSDQLLGVLLLVGYSFSVPTSFPDEEADFFIRFGLLAAGLVLLVMILPYLKKGEQNGFWQYNKTLFFRLFVTAIFSIVLFAGLAIALAALDKLFDISVPGRRYGELWVLAAGLFAPWFFLAGVPEDLEGLDKREEYPKGLKIFAQYVLLSLVIVYLLILYAYLLKILIQWSWPKGWVSSLIIGFSATSILSLLLMHPVRGRSENAWIRAAGKWLYIVLIPLIVVLFLAVTERIGDYGITESRYAGIALGIWLVAQVLYFLFSKSKSIKFTIGSLCLLAFTVSFGPWGMLSVSERSQVGRLHRLLTKDGVLINGRVNPEHGKVSREDAQEISSIVSYLNRTHGYEAIRPWFADKLKEDTKPGYAVNLAPPKVLDKMGIEFIGYSRGAGGPTFSLFETKEAVDISGYDRLLRQQVVNRECHFEGEGIAYDVIKDLGSMTIVIGSPRTGFNAVQVDIAAFASQLLHDYGNTDAARDMKPERMAVEAERNGQKVKVFFRNLNVIRRDGKAVVTSFTADIAYTVRKEESMGNSDTASWQLTQVGVVVKDVNQVAERLAFLGIGPFQEMKLPPDRHELFRGKPALADAKILAAPLGGTQLELIQPLARESPHREYLETKGEGIQHIMVVVDDIEKEIKRLTDKGCTVLLDIHMPGGLHGAYIDLHAGGLIVEMFQKGPNQP